MRRWIPNIAAPGGGAEVFFGGDNVNSDGSVNGAVSYEFLGAAVLFRNNNTLTPITATASGTVKDLHVWCKSRGGTVTIRMAVYNTSLVLLGEGSASSTFTQTSGGWEGFSTFAAPFSLVNGTNYLVSVAADSALFSFGYTGTTGAGYYYKAGDYTGAAMPNPFPTHDNDNGQKLIFRIGI